MPTIGLIDDEYAALTAALRQPIEQDKFPHAPRLAPLRSALAKLEAGPKLTLEPPPPLQARGGKRSRRKPN
jgi:hypothetical protein